MKSSCLWFSLAALAFGQPPAGGPDFRVGPIYTNGFPNIEIVLEPGAGASLDPAGLQLTEEGIRTSAASGLRKFSETGQGATMLLALDASGSMRGRPLNAVRKGLGQFVAKARANDKVGIVSFADDVRWEATWSGTRDETRQKLEGIRARGRRTVLWDAVDSALDELAKVDGPARRHLVVISDGHDEGSKRSLPDVIAKAVRLRIPVDSIGMTRSNPRYLANLQSLSAQSQGSYTVAPDLNALTQLVGNAIDGMLNSPVARFHVEKLKADGAEHRIGVFWKSAGKQHEMSVALPAATEQQSQPNAPAQPQTEHKTFPWWYAAIAGGVLLVMLVAWILLRRPKAGMPAPVAQQPWTPPPPSPDAWRPQPEFNFPPPVSEVPRVVNQRTPTLPESGELPPSNSGPGLPASAPAPARARTQYVAGFQPPALLIAKSGPLTGQSFRIDRGDFWVGAEANNHVRLDDETVSGHHAFFRFEADTLKVFDNHSTNSTWVNRQPVTDTARILAPGDEIRIGRSLFVVERAQENSKNLAQPGSPFALS